MGGRVAEGACLENQYVRKGIEGSNPSPSATAPHGPPSWPCGRPGDGGVRAAMSIELNHTIVRCRDRERSAGFLADIRSEEHTSELQSLMRISYAVFCLKKKTQKLIHKRKYNNNHT